MLDGVQFRWPRAGTYTLAIEHPHLQRGERVPMRGDSSCDCGCSK